MNSSRFFFFLFLPLLLVGLAFGQNRETNDTLRKQYKDLLWGHRPAVAEAQHATVNVVVDGKQCALGTVIHPNGYVLTKASEMPLEGKEYRVMLGGSTLIPATLEKTYKKFDLALLKAKTDKPMAAVTLYEGKPPALGTFVAAAAPGREDPLAIGVLSVKARPMANERAFLGVSLDTTADKVLIDEVIEGTCAFDAGLKAGDVILKLDGKAYKTAGDFINAVGGYDPGDRVKMVVQRGDDVKDYEVQLRKRSSLPPQRQQRFDRMNRMGGELSARLADFPSVFQTDLPVSPAECGGPVCDLDGNVLGINIARAGRIKTYTIPSSKIVALLKDEAFMKAAPMRPAPSGVVASPDASGASDATAATADPTSIRKQIERSLAEIKASRTALDLAEKQLRESLKAVDQREKAGKK